jgi:hypothetical protein
MLKIQVNIKFEKKDLPGIKPFNIKKGEVEFLKVYRFKIK